MGARQSYLYIFLEYMDGQYGSGKGDHTEYTVESSKGVLDECDSFEVVTHKIQITKGDPKSYDIYIYNSRSVASKASYIFGYCSPRVDTHVAKEVKAYYSVLSPHTPLAITFVRENEHNHHCATDKLKEAGWDWASSITKYSSSDLAAMLKESFTELSWDYSIHFTDGKDNINIMGRKMEIDNDKFYRVILVPNKGDGTLGIQCMYCLDPPKLNVNCAQPASGKQTQIDPYFLNGILKNYYYGIVLYFGRKGPKPNNYSDEKDYNNMLLYAEFTGKCGTTSLKRKDNEGCWWTKEKLKYKNYQERVSALTSAKEGAEKNTLNTVIIDKYTNYICGRNVKTEEKDTFNIYTHQFEKSQSLNLIFEVQNIKIGSYDLSQVTATKVEVYYLKAGGKNDDKPFLLVFDKDGDGKIKKVYHFQITRVFKDWQEFTLVEKLDEKLQKISDKGKCTKELGLLRTLVYRILTTDDDDVHVKPPDATEEVRPAPLPPEPIPPEGPDWLLIIGSSVGAFLFVCLLAIGYGIYWYNTTIKLLT